jgi:sugar phosphate isomerase/epimerase
VFDWAENPLISDLRAIEELQDRTGVLVRSVCADCFMEAPLQRDQESKLLMEVLLKNASSIGVGIIVIPCVDQSSFSGVEDQKKFVNTLSSFLPLAERFDIRFALETDLNPTAFNGLLDSFDSDMVGVNYDTGNSASLCLSSFIIILTFIFSFIFVNIIIFIVHFCNINMFYN